MYKVNATKSKEKQRRVKNNIQILTAFLPKNIDMSYMINIILLNYSSFNWIKPEFINCCDVYTDLMQNPSPVVRFAAITYIQFVSMIAMSILISMRITIDYGLKVNTPDQHCKRLK